eukprot:5943441-Amphidinium_carterae.1
MAIQRQCSLCYMSSCLLLSLPFARDARSSPVLKSCIPTVQSHMGRLRCVQTEKYLEDLLLLEFVVLRRC